MGGSFGDSGGDGAIGGGDVAPVETEGLEGGGVGDVPQLLAGGGVAEAAVIASIEGSLEEVGLGALVFERSGDEADGDGELGTADGSGDLEDKGAVGDEPAADHLAVGFAADEFIGLAVCLVTDDVGDNEGGAVGGMAPTGSWREASGTSLRWMWRRVSGSLVAVADAAAPITMDGAGARCV